MLVRSAAAAAGYRSRAGLEVGTGSEHLRVGERHKERWERELRSR